MLAAYPLLENSATKRCLCSSKSHMIDLDATATRYHNDAMRKIFKTSTFNRWMRKTPLSDKALCMAVNEMERGLIDADLGAGIIKKRVPLPGRGKSGSVRTLVVSKRNRQWFFLYGFEKSEKDNITRFELAALQDAARALLAFSDSELDSAIAMGRLTEVHNGEEQNHG